MLLLTKQQVYKKLQQQAADRPSRLYLKKRERQIYVDSLDELVVLLYSQKPKLSLIHPMFRGIKIYLEN